MFGALHYNLVLLYTLFKALRRVQVGAGPFSCCTIFFSYNVGVGFKKAYF